MRRIALAACLAAVAALSGGGAIADARQTEPLVTPTWTRLDFGRVAVGETAWRDVVFTNVSDRPVYLVSGYSAGSPMGRSRTWPAFGTGYPSQCFSPLAPGASCSQPIRFTPNDSGEWLELRAYLWTTDPVTWSQSTEVEVFTMGHAE